MSDAKCVFCQVGRATIELSMNNTSRAKSIFFLLLSLAVGLLLFTNASLAQEEYFDESGHMVAGEWLRFFEEHGGLRVFGYPISPVLAEGDIKVQYFQNGRLEMGSDNKVRLTLLSYELSLRKTGRILESQVPAGGVYYPTTGHSVVMAFLDFYLHYGGPSLFGYPLTELVNENDRLVQYFERVIFEWRPELPDGERVQLIRLGEMYLPDNSDAWATIYAPPDGYPVTHINASVAVRAPVTRRQTNEQIIYVRVHDQLGKPVEAAKVEAFILWPDLGQRNLIVPTQSTNADGTAIFSFMISALSDIAPLAAGDTVPIQIQVSFDEHEDRTATAFRIWW